MGNSFIFVSEYAVILELMKMYHKGVLLFFCLSFLSHCMEGAKLLAIFHYPGKSQYMSGVALMKILAESGHEVTMVSPSRGENLPENYRDVVLPEVFELTKRFTKNYFDYKMHPYVLSYVVGKVSFSLLNATLSHPKLKRLLESETFDLAIIQQFYSEALTYIPHFLNIPFVFYSPMGASYITNPSVGNPNFPSYIPDLFLHYRTHMSFFQRLDNTVVFIINIITRNFIFLPHHDRIVRETFPDAPYISDYCQKASIVLLNGDVSINEPVPKVPGMIDIGGFHIKPPKSLPRDLEDIMNTASSGVIYFSMGSNLRSSDMPKYVLNVLLNVFSKLNQTILWKYENDELEGKPDNVVIRKWLPQNDILAHKKMKLFITHAGLHSIQETVYHGVPCLAIPVFMDQLSNAKGAVHAGYAEVIYLEEITEENFLFLITKLLYNSNYTTAAKRRSNIMRDRPLSPAETAVFWVNYVIRHKGADHLKVGSLKLTWYQYLLVDVVLFIILSLLIIIFILKKLLSILHNLINWKKKEKKE